MKIASSKGRILEFIDYKQISIVKFLTQTGIKRGFLDTDKLNASISDVFLAKIITAYPEINIERIITGVGEMLKENNTHQSHNEMLINAQERVKLYEEKIAFYIEKIEFLENKLQECVCKSA
jgi:hypothetical protein